MSTDIKRFLEYVKDKKESNGKRVVFSVCCSISSGIEIAYREGPATIRLDNEDIAYLERKYMKKLKDEMEENIKKIREDYSKL